MGPIKPFDIKPSYLLDKKPWASRDREIRRVCGHAIHPFKLPAAVHGLAAVVVEP